MSFTANTQNFYFKSMSEQLKMGNNNKISNEIMSVVNEKYINFNFDILTDVDEYTHRTKYQDILEECKKNIWFFFREIIRIPVPGQPHTYDSSMYFPLNMTSLKMIWCYKHHIPFFVCTNGNDYIRDITLKLLWVYDYITKISNDKASFSILFTNDNDINLFISQLYEIIAINSEILPSLFSLDVNNIKERIQTANNQILESKITNDVIFGFNMHNYSDIFNIFKLNRDYEKKSFFVLEGDYDKIVNNDLRIYLSSLMTKMKLSYLELSDDDISVLQTMMLYIYDDEYSLGYDSRSIEYRKKIL